MNLSSNITSVFKATKAVVTANSPVLLVGAAIAGVVSTAVLAAKGGYKARGIIDEATQDGTIEITVQEKFSLTWLCYAAPAVTGISTIASVVGIHVIHNKRNAAMAGLYAVTSGKLDEMREEAEQLLGNKKTQALNDTMSQKALDANPLSPNTEVVILDEPSALCMDEWSGRYFMGSVNKIEKAIAAVNYQIMEEGSASLNDFYDLLGLKGIDMGERFGWDKDKTKTVLGVFGAGTATDGRPAVTISFQTAPKDSMGRGR